MKHSPILLLALVFIAGCVGTSTVKVIANDGIVIEKFTADPSDVFDFQTTTFSLDIANTGGTTATRVEAKLLNVEGIWRRSSDKFPIGAEGTLISSAFAVQLSPPRVKDNIPGDSRFLSAIFIAPNLREGDRQTFPVKARVTYDYKTTGSIIMKAVSYERLKVLQNRGQSVSDSLSESNSESPVKMKFSKGSVPIVVNTQELALGQTVVKRDFRFEITNVGSGFPITDNKVGQIGGTTTGNRIILKAPSGIILESCTGQKSGNSNSFSIDLRSDGTAPLSCTVAITPVTLGGFNKPTDEVSLTFDFELNYRYYVEKDVSVSVQGTKTDDTSPGPAPGATSTSTTSTSTSTTTSVPLDAAAPTVLAKNPVGTGASKTPSIQITFSEKMDKPSVQNAFSLKAGTPLTTIAVNLPTWSAEDQIVTFVPSSSLAASTEHTVTLSTAAKDLVGNPLAAETTWTFTTSA